MDLRLVIEKLGLDKNNFLGSGMESVVFDNQDGTVSKVYPKGFNLIILQRLKEFYQSLDLTNFPVKLPIIREIKVLDDYIIVIESKLDGKSLTKDLLKKLSSSEMEFFLDNYIDILFQMKNIKTEYLKEGKSLDKSKRFFVNQEFSSWKVLLIQSLDFKYKEYGPALEKFVSNFENKYLKIRELIKNLPELEGSLVHGDFYPGNLLVDDNFHITAVIDFGLVTTKGDYLFDIATGWVFSDIFDEIKNFDIKSYVLEKIKQKLNLTDLKRIYLYILVFSFISAQMYSKDENDGHFLWCVSNLNREEYWNRLHTY